MFTFLVTQSLRNRLLVLALAAALMLAGAAIYILRSRRTSRPGGE